jgi:hypothetical protein
VVAALAHECKLLPQQSGEHALISAAILDKFGPDGGPETAPLTQIARANLSKAALSDLLIITAWAGFIETNSVGSILVALAAQKQYVFHTSRAWRLRNEACSIVAALKAQKHYVFHIPSAWRLRQNSCSKVPVPCASEHSFPTAPAPVGSETIRFPNCPRLAVQKRHVSILPALAGSANICFPSFARLAYQRQYMSRSSRAWRLIKCIWWIVPASRGKETIRSQISPRLAAQEHYVFHGSRETFGCRSATAKWRQNLCAT